MVSTRRQRRGNAGNVDAGTAGDNALVTQNLALAPANSVSTSTASVQTDNRERGWPNCFNDMQNHGSSNQSDISLNESAIRRKTSDVLKLARDIIPNFDGTNMSVNMFIEHCRAAAASVEEQDMNLLIMLIKNKITGQARKHIQNKIGANLEEILKSLQRAFSPRADISQLAQELAVIKRKQDENVADYGIRVSDILNKIIIKVMDKNPGTTGLERCQEYKENTIKNFMRGLDRETLYFIKDRFPSTLDDAIELAAEADAENITWNSVHGIKDEKPNTSNFNFDSRKRVAAISGIESEGTKTKSLSSIQCFGCNDFGHYKRNCPNRGNSQKRRSNNNQDQDKTVCSYCELDNHTIADCRLKRKHDMERKNKRARFMQRRDLNSNQSHSNGVELTQNANQNPENASYLISEAEKN